MNKAREKQNFTLGRLKYIDGVLHKRCAGPSHDEPTYLPATTEYFYEYKSPKTKQKTRGRFVCQCKLCHLFGKVKSGRTDHGYIPVILVKPFYIEAVNRVGVKELSRRTGLHRRGIVQIIRGQTKYVQKDPLKRVMTQLLIMREKNESKISGRIRWQTERRMDRGTNLGRCMGCGCELDAKTLDCDYCIDRHRKRRSREAA